MTLLLDTCVLLWAWAEPEKLGGRLRGLLEDPHNQVWVSAASAWEIATRHRIGKFPAGGAIIVEWDDRIARDGFRELEVSCAHALRAASLPGTHRDSFDRMLAAQGIMENIRVATPDPAIAALGADTIW